MHPIAVFAESLIKKKPECYPHSTHLAIPMKLPSTLTEVSFPYISTTAVAAYSPQSLCRLLLLVQMAVMIVGTTSVPAALEAHEQID